jgi:predicted Fe-Mo cluster-binding NifX family protein
MKIAVTSTGTGMDSPVDPRFGRCPYIALVDLESGELEVEANPFKDAMGGAGTQVAQWVINQGAGALLTGSCGPKACAVLEDARVQVVDRVSGTVREAVEGYRRKGQEATRPEAEFTPRERGRGGGPGLGVGRGPVRGRGRGDGWGSGAGRGRGRGPGAGRGPGGGPAG